MMTRPRSFIWQRNIFGPPTPQIVYGDQVGSLDIKPLVDPIKLDPSDTRSLGELAKDYPAPATVET